MRPLTLLCCLGLYCQHLTFGQSMQDFNALCRYQLTDQIEKVDSIKQVIGQRLKTHSDPFDQTLMYWSSFMVFDQQSNLPEKESILARCDSLIKATAVSDENPIQIIRSIMKGIVLRGHYDPAGLLEFQKAIPLLKKMINIDPTPYVIAKNYQLRNLATLGMWDEAILQTDSLVEFCEVSIPNDRELLSNTYKINGQLHDYLGNIKKAELRYRQSIGTLENQISPDNPYIALLEGDQCGCLSTLMIFKKAEICYEKLFSKIRNLNIQLTDIDLAGLYYNASSPMIFTGNLEQREDYLLKAISLAKDLSQPMLMGFAYDALAGGARSQGDYQHALDYSQKSIQALTTEDGELNVYGQSLLYTYAHYASEYGALTIADSIFDVCIENAESWFIKSDNFSTEYFNLLNWYADHQFRMGNKTIADAWTKKLYSYTNRFEDISPTWIAYLEYHLIENLTDQEQYDQASAKIDAVFRKLYAGTTYPSSGTPNPDSLILVEDIFKLYWQNIANTYLQNIKKDIDHNIPILNVEIEKLLHILREIKIKGAIESEEHAAKTEYIYTSLMKLYNLFYEQTHDVSYLGKIAHLSNELKTGTNEYIIHHASTQNADSTQQLLAQQLEVLEWIDNDLGEQHDNSTHMSLLQEKDSMRTAMIETRTKLYRRIPANKSALNVNELRNSLGDDEVVIDYYFDQNIVDALFISRDTIFFTNWKADHFIGRLTEQYYDAQISLSSTDSMAFLLYKALLQPIEHQITQRHLTIVPHSQMYYLNFETLQKSPDADSKKLITEYTIRQIQRVGDLLTSTLEATPVGSNVMAFSPDFNDELISSYKKGTPEGDQDNEYIALASLTYFGQQIESLKKDLKLTFFKGKEAQEQTYFKHAANASVLHLASHAILDNFNPMNSHIFFTKLNESKNPLNDGRLHLYEIVNQELNAELAILTACNTGKGGIAYGGGPNTLSSSFNLAGVPSVIHTLWSVDEFSTADIITRFYEHTRNGLTAGTALRKAKLDFIDQAPVEQQKPYYWAGLVLIGEDTNLTFEQPVNWVVWSCLFLFIISFLWLLRKIVFDKKSELK